MWFHYKLEIHPPVICKPLVIKHFTSNQSKNALHPYTYKQ